MSFNLIRTKLIDNLDKHIDLITPNHSIKDVYKYASIPPGKMFRPLIVYSISKDLNKSGDTNILLEKSAISLICSAIEIHHSYTLVHDDLPCMDNDDQRRGKPSAHKKYGQWKALLVGDGLAIGSFQLLSYISCNNKFELIKLFSWALGPKGLIQGQVLDLSEEMNIDFNNLLRTHSLKTGRLIQVSVLSGLLLNKLNYTYREYIDFFKIGHILGIIFQLFDDLTELVDKELSQHELNVNPWLKYEKESFYTIESYLNKLNNYIDLYELNAFKNVISEYFVKLKKIIVTNRKTIESHLLHQEKKKLDPIIISLDFFT